VLRAPQLALPSLALVLAGGISAADGRPLRALEPFLDAHCIDCHDDVDPEGGLDFYSLSTDLDDPEARRHWVLAFDRVAAGEMPPEDEARPDPDAADAFLATLGGALEAADRQRAARDGRAVRRRLNRHEYEHTLRDLLELPWLQVRDILPEDGEQHHFNKVGEALDVSHVQMSRYLQAADHALRAAIAPQVDAPAAEARRFHARDQPSMARRMFYSPFNRSPERATYPLVDHAADLPILMGEAPPTRAPWDPEARAREAVGVTAGSYEPLLISFDEFQAPLDGRYRLRLEGYTFWAAPQSERQWWRPSRSLLSKGRTREPVSLYAFARSRPLRKLGDFDVAPEPAVDELEVELLAGETIRPDAARLFRSRPPGWHNPLATREGQPGVAYRWLEVEGPLHDQWPPASHRVLFDDLPLRAADDGVEVVSRDPRADAERLLRGFLERAYRVPAAEEDVALFLGLIHAALDRGRSFQESMLAGYTAVLCSPAFLTLDPRPGALDDHALAERLSYFLINSAPDRRLRDLAAAGELRDPETLAGETRRLLADPKSRRFVEAFADYWLDLRHLDATTPDARLYPDYYLDDQLGESALEESYRFLATLIAEDLPVRHLVDSDFAILNQRLARHYGIDGVEGVAMRRVPLPPDSRRGGLITQAAVLKVTANGTNTSPVMRGVWFTERILGQPPPPPPPAVPAVEPDTRGATTIREQLEKHRADPSCAGCHAKIDPVGFALENFDVFGGWRERYRAFDPEVPPNVAGFGKNGQRFRFHLAQQVDASGTLPGGGEFDDVDQLRALLLDDQRQLARNLVGQLATFATGAPVRFGDRDQVERILDRAEPSGYPVATLIDELVRSDLFRHK